MTQLAMQTEMDDYTVEYMKKAMFENGTAQLTASDTFSDIDLDWGADSNLKKRRPHEKNEGWFWDGEGSAEGITWGGCLESIDAMLQHDIQIPSLEQFKEIILFTETSEEIPAGADVSKFYRALGERGILERVQGILVGRPKAWSLDDQRTPGERQRYREEQREAITAAVREYNKTIPIVQNMDFGHTNPQIPIPYGKMCRIDGSKKVISCDF